MFKGIVENLRKLDFWDGFGGIFLPAFMLWAGFYGDQPILGMVLEETGTGLLAGSVLVLAIVVFSALKHIYRKGLSNILFVIWLIALALPVAFAGVYTGAEAAYFGHCVPDLSDFHEGLYFSYTTMTTLGYGDLKPENWCQLLTSFQAMLGLFTVGVVPAYYLDIQRSRDKADLG
jgi:hypothetical protein